MSGLPTGDLLDTVTVTVDLPVPGAALAIGAHPDDIEFGAGATLAKWAAAGCRRPPPRPDRRLQGELGPGRGPRPPGGGPAARVPPGGRLDVDPGRSVDDDRVRFLGAVDGELANDAGHASRGRPGHPRRCDPTCVLGHDPWRRYRLHPDHRAAGFLTLDALVAARDPHFFPELGLDPHRPTALLLWEADLRQPRRAGRRASRTTKVDALLCHHSQLETTMGLDRRGDGAGTDVRRGERVRRPDRLAAGPARCRGRDRRRARRST